MNKASLCLFGGALLGAGLSSTANADLSHSGYLDILQSYDSGYGYDYIGNGYGSDYSFNYGAMQIHTFDFTVNSGGFVYLDALSWDMFSSFTDTQIRLFQNDGNALSENNHIAQNDDYGYDYRGGGYGSEIDDFNGSISYLDSFLEIFLEAGDYTVAIGGLWFSEDDANNRQGIGWAYSNNSFEIPDGAEYQLDIIGNVSATVPTPGTLALLSMGGFLGTRRRR